jgi:hypothetical protein
MTEGGGGGREAGLIPNLIAGCNHL